MIENKIYINELWDEEEAAKSVKVGAIYVSLSTKQLSFVTKVEKSFADGIGDFYTVCYYFLDKPEKLLTRDPYAFIKFNREYNEYLREQQHINTRSPI